MSDMVNVNFVNKIVKVEFDEDITAAAAHAIAAKQAAEQAEANAEIWAEGTDAQVAPLGGTHSAKVWAQSEEKVYYIDNVAAMRADAFCVPGMLVMTKGYYSPNDGGAATYNIRAAEPGDVDDGGSIIVLDNGNVAELIRTSLESQYDIVDDLDLIRSLFLCGLPFDDYIATQGMCVANDYLIVSVYASDDSDHNRVYSFDINNKTVVNYVSGSFGHMNSMCYDANNGYVCVVNSGTIHRLTISNNGTLAYHDDVVLGFTNYLTAIAWYDGLYYAKSGAHVYVTPDLSTIEREFDVEEKDDVVATRQGMDVDRNFMFVCDSAHAVGIQRICIYNIINGELLKTLYYPYGTYGEIESIALYNGFAFININRPTKDSMLGVYKVPIYKSTLVEPDYARARCIHSSVGKLQTFYVDNSNIFSFGDGDETSPFNSLYYAIKLAAFSPYCVINVSGTYTGTVTIVGCPNITFNIANVYFNDLYINNCGFIVLNSDGTGKIKTISAENTDLILHNVVLDGESNTQAPLTKCIACKITGSAKIIGYTTSNICSGNCYFSNINIENIAASAESTYRGWSQTAEFRYPQTIALAGTADAGVWTASCDTAFAAIVTFSSTTGRAGNRVYFVNGYGAGGSARTKYYRVPLDEDDGIFVVAVDANSNSVTFTKTDTTHTICATLTVLNNMSNSYPVSFTFTPST